MTGANSAVRPSGVLLANAQLTAIVAEDWIVFQTIRLLPATGYGIIVGSALVSSLAFDLKRDGKLNYNPAWDVSQCGFLKGLGSDTLTFLGYPLTVDATAVSEGLNINVANFPPSTTGKADTVLLPAKGYALQLANAPSNISFNLELDGKLTFNAPLSNSITLENEAGGPILRVLDVPANQLSFPFVGAGDTQDPLFSLINAGTGKVVLATSEGDHALGFLSGKDPLFNRDVGVYGESDNNGIIGKTNSNVDTGVFGENDGTGNGVAVFSSKGTGVSGVTDTGVGVQGESRGTGLAGKFIGNVKVAAAIGQQVSVDVDGIITAGSFTANAVEAVCGFNLNPQPNPPPLPQHNGVYASTTHKDGSGVYGQGGGRGVYGVSSTGVGVVGESDQFDGVFGISHNPKTAGISGHNLDSKGKDNPHGLAGWFGGDVQITQDLMACPGVEDVVNRSPTSIGENRASALQ